MDLDHYWQAWKIRLELHECQLDPETLSWLRIDNVLVKCVSNEGIFTFFHVNAIGGIFIVGLLASMFWNQTAMPGGDACGNGTRVIQLFLIIKKN